MILIIDVLMIWIIHSKDLEDPVLHISPARCGCLHGKRLHEDAGPLSWSPRVCAIPTPPYSKQGAYILGFFKVCMMWTSLWFLYRHRRKCWCLHFVKHPNNIGHDMNHIQIALSFFHSHGHGVMGITPSSTTLTRTLCPLVTRDLTTEQDGPCRLNCLSPLMDKLLTF